MRRRSLTTKFLSLFLVAFVCLNAGGALCVAYCQSSIEAFHLPQEHCPLKKKAEHSDPDQQNGQAAINIGGSEADCCPMTVSFIAAPIEKSSFAVKAPATALIAAFEPGEPLHFTRNKPNIPTAYRGPPLDQRISRLKNGVIRI